MLNKFSLLMFAVALTTVLVSCQKDDETNPDPANGDPVADFTMTGHTSPAPATVTFTNKSVNATTYFWEFGDGEGSVEQSPQHTYTSGGSFIVSLKAIGNGKSHEVTHPVVILSTPVTKMRITKFQVNSYDATQNWDLWDGPDPYIEVQTASGAALVTTAVKNNVGAGNLPLIYNTSYTISTLTNTYRVMLYDEDTGLDDSMGGYNFSPSNFQSGTPSTITLYNTGSALQIILTVQWL